MKKKLVRITTVPISLDKLLEGQLKFMSQYYKVCAISSDEKALKKVGEKEGVNIHVIEMTRKITPIKDIIALFNMYVFLKKEKPYIVHTHTPKAGIIGMIASKLANVPVRLHTVAGLPLLESTGTKRKVLDFIEKLTYSCATKVYPNSFGLKKIIEYEEFTNPYKLKVIGNGSSNGIDTEYFNKENISEALLESKKNQLGISKNDFVFIFVGRIVEDKGINELVEAFCNLIEKHKNIKLLLVGSFEEDLDPVKSETKRLIQNTKNIIATGYKDDVRPYFAASHVLTFPSYREGFPNVVMQAGAMGLSSIVSNINGCNEIITEGINGSIVSVKDVKSLQLKMESYLLDNDKYNTMKKQAREVIVQKYQRSTVLETLLDEYRKFE